MVVLSIIVGVLLMMAGIACLFSPGATFLASGYVLAILMLIYGIVGIVNVIRKKAHPAMLVVDLLAVIIGVIAILKPGTTLAIDILMTYLVAAWFVIQGGISIYVSIKARAYQSGWVFGLILGIIGVLLGAYSFFNPMVSALAIGILIGIYLIEAGLSMIVLATAVESVDEQQP